MLQTINNPLSLSTILPSFQMSLIFGTDSSSGGNERSEMMLYSEAFVTGNLKISHEKCEGHVHKSTYDYIHVCVN